MLPEKHEKTLADQVLEKSSNRELVRSYGNLTMDKVLKGNYPSMAALKRHYGEDKIENMVAVLVQDASSYFDKTLSDEQAKDIGAEVLASYPSLRIEDLFVMLQELKQSELYGKLTPNKILAKTKKYFEKRTELAGTMSLNEHLATKDPRANTDPYQGNGFKAFAHAYNLKKFEEKIKNHKSK